jgi:hypothetical protein
MSKLPAFQFYPGDWMKDPNLKRCTHSAKGVLMDVLCLMFECEERGVLVTNGRPWSDDEIVASVGGHADVTALSLRELFDKCVLRRRSDGAVYSARMVRDEENRSKDRERQQKSREKRKIDPCHGVCHADVTPDVTPMSHHSSSSSSSSASADRDIGEGLSVELPNGFPRTKQEGQSHAAFVGCPEQFAGETWDKAVSRGGRDAKEAAIRSWRHYLASEWKYERERIEKQKHGTHNQTPTKRVSRSVGTANEGKHDQYKIR